MPSAFSTLLLMTPCRRLQFNLSDMFPVPRLGLAALSAALKAHGYPHTHIRDIIALREWIPGLLAHLHAVGAPDLLGLSVTILSLREAFEIARAVKGAFPRTRVVVGGPGVGFGPEPLLRHGEAVDFFVRGEGEAPIVALVRALDGGGDLAEVPGLLWRDGDTPRENPPGEYLELDAAPRLDWDALPMERYRLHPPMGAYPPATMMETARGCTYPCEFCCLSMTWRAMSPRRVEEEVRWLQGRFGIREVHFIDPTFTLSRERALEICGRLAPLGLRWSCKTRVDRLDPELARRMADAGCYLVAFGVETGDDATLGRIGKRAAARDAEETFATCRAVGIRTTAYLLVASPGETDETVRHNIAWVRRLRPDYVLYDVLQADPKNPLTRQRITEGLFSHKDLEAYYLSDGPSWLHHNTVAGHDMATARRWLFEASTDFYLRPRYLWERVRDLRTLQDLANLGVGGATFLKDAVGRGRLWGLGDSPVG